MPILANAHLLEELGSIGKRPGSRGYFQHRRASRASRCKGLRRATEGGHHLTGVALNPRKRLAADRVSDLAIFCPDGSKRLVMAIYKATRCSLKANVELALQPFCRCNLGLQHQKGREEIIRNEKPDGKLVGFNLLTFVLPGGSGLAQVAEGAGKAPAQPQNMPLQQEMPEFVGDTKPRRLRPAPSVDKNAPLTADLICKKNPFAAFKWLASDLSDPETGRDLVDWDGARQRADLFVQRFCKPLRIMDIG